MIFLKERKNKCIFTDTHLEAVKTRWSLIAIALIGESVFISANGSQFRIFQKRMTPPRQEDSSTSPQIAIPETHPLCALLRLCKEFYRLIMDTILFPLLSILTCRSSPFLRSQRLIPVSLLPENNSTSTPVAPVPTTND